MTRSTLPWITADLDQLRRERDKLYRAFKRSRTESTLQRYRDARNIFHGKISDARSSYYYQRLSGISDPRLLWRELRHLGLTLSRLGSTAVFPSDELNAHFAQVSTCRTSAAAVAEFLERLPPPQYNDDLFYLADITPGALEAAFRHFSSQSRGTDDISLRNLSDALPVIFPFILLVLNRSILTAEYPQLWKRARIVPLAKVESPSTLNDFRPIAILCALSKVFERVIHTQIVTYLDSRGLLDPHQSGFRRGFSTQSALIKVMDDVRLGIDQRRLTVLVLFDFSKAFDTVPHVILLRKLLDLRFSQHSVRWIASYLTGRQQAVVGHGGVLSSWVSLGRGVPQGSVLGPLLFSLFINDLSPNLHHAEHMVYADDLQIYLQCIPSELPDALSKLQADVTAVLDWASANSLHLNAGKTKSIILGSTPFITRLDLDAVPRLVLRDEPISYTDTVRNLGLMIDSKLTWSEQISSVSNRVYSVLRQLSASRSLLSRALRKRLVAALAFPLMDYCCIAYTDIAGTLDTKLTRLLNSCVRFVCGVRRDVHITPFRRELGWLCIRDRRRYFLGTLIYTLLQTERPMYLSCLFSRRRGRDPSNPNPPRTNRGELVVPLARTESYKRSFAVYGADFWNSSPEGVTSAATIDSFKCRLFAYLFETEEQRLR